MIYKQFLMVIFATFYSCSLVSLGNPQDETRLRVFLKYSPLAQAIRVKLGTQKPQTEQEPSKILEQFKSDKSAKPYLDYINGQPPASTVNPMHEIIKLVVAEKIGSKALNNHFVGNPKLEKFVSSNLRTIQNEEIKIALGSVQNGTIAPANIEKIAKLPESWLINFKKNLQPRDTAISKALETSADQIKTKREHLQKSIPKTTLKPYVSGKANPDIYDKKLLELFPTEDKPKNRLTLKKAAQKVISRKRARLPIEKLDPKKTPKGRQQK